MYASRLEITLTMAAEDKNDGPKELEGVDSYKSPGDVIEGQASARIGVLHRRLANRQIQLVAIGGSIGTGLYKGGPASLLIAFIIEALMVGMLNNCLAEMTTYMPVSGGFIRLAGKWVDEAFGFMAGWNFFIYMALTVPFEISAVNLLLEYWRDDIPVVAVCIACIVAYG